MIIVTMIDDHHDGDDGDDDGSQACNVGGGAGRTFNTHKTRTRLIQLYPVCFTFAFVNLLGHHGFHHCLFISSFL